MPKENLPSYSPVKPAIPPIIQTPLPAESKESLDIKELKARLEEQSKTIEILKDSVSKNKLDQATKAHDDTVKYPSGFLKKLKGKVIVKWLGVNDPGSEAKQELVYQNNAPVGEQLTGHYIALDGSKIVCNMLEFVRTTEREKFDIIGQDGDKLTIRFHNSELPQEYEISTKYVNP